MDCTTRILASESFPMPEEPGARSSVEQPHSVAEIGGSQMKGVLAWMVGIPIPIIIILYLVNVF